ncbi:MAG: HlyD family efflux transporter periplasmic adaptor subunit, partial [Candidatus Nealsonbacteria bacterium]|nr:HlyD family efflux transporter periplasmic adaptor subunit [Candidatus Nealsonbacteria bacterium]
IAIYATAGQKVKAGTLLAIIDSQDAQKTVRDAKLSLDSANLTFESANNDFAKTYEQTLNYLDSSIPDLTTAMEGLKDILFSDSVAGNGQWNLDIFIAFVENYQSSSGKYNNYDLYYNSYQNAKKAYYKNLADYKTTNRNSSNDQAIKSLIDETYQTLKLIADSLKNASNLLGDYKKKINDLGFNLNSNIPTYISYISEYQGKINADITNILTSKNSINSANGEPLVLQSQQLSLRQKENALLDAQQTLSDYYIRAPFDGIIASVDALKGDSASSATAIATVITQKQVAGISLSEVDAAKIKSGQKANLIFDAIPDLNITGQVSEIDSIGTVLQGVVTYNAKISLDVQDERIKPEMSVSANIITSAKSDVLMIPNSALKQQNGNYYVETANEPGINYSLASAGIILKNQPIQKQVQIGSANDEYTEITSGLNEGDEIISRTIQASSVKTQTQSTQSGSNALRGVGGGFGR